MHAAKHHAHAIHGRAELLVIADIGADAQRRSAGMLDLEFGGVEFRLAARQQPNPGARLREAQRQALADPAARPRNQYAFLFER